MTLTQAQFCKILEILRNAQTTIYDRPVGSNPRLVITTFGLEAVEKQLKEFVVEDSADYLKEALIEVANEYKAEEIKVYYISNKDYCIKMIKDDKIVKCVRRGTERGKKNVKRRRISERVRRTKEAEENDY